MAKQKVWQALSRAATIVFVTIFLTGCQQLSNLLNPDKPDGGETIAVSLADSVIDAFIAKVQGTSFSRALDAEGRLTRADLEALRITIKNKVVADGLDQSSNIDQVLPSVMVGISAGVKNLRDLDGDTYTSAELISVALESTSLSLKNNLTKLSSGDVVVADILQEVVKTGATDLADIAKTDPESAGKALESVAVAVSSALVGGTVTEEAVLKAVVTASVQAAVQSNKPELVQAVFAGTAKTEASETVLGTIVSEAVVKARDGQADGTLLDSDTAGSILKQAAAGLGDKAGDAVIASATTALSEQASVTIPEAELVSIKAAAEETAPVATLSAAIGGAAYEGAELDYSPDARTVTFTTAANPDTTEELLAPDGSTIASGTYALTGSGAFRFILLVKNTNGTKSAFASVVIRVKAMATEPTPVAALAVKAGDAAVPATLTWSPEGHALTFDTTGSTEETKARYWIQSDNPNAKPVFDIETEKWSVVQKSGKVTYTLTVKNIGGTKSAKATVVVTVGPEPAPVAVLKAYNGTAEITAPLARKASYDIVLKTAGTTEGAAVDLSVSPSTTLVNNGDGTWTATLLATVPEYTFTLVAKNASGIKSTTLVKKYSIAAEVQPKAVLKILNGTTAVSALEAKTGGYDLILDPKGSTLEGTDLTIDDGGKNTVLVKNENGTWTAKAVQTTTTFTLTVKNQGGEKSATISATVTITVAKDEAGASADVKTGWAQLEAHNWTAAKTAFTSALIKNPDDKDAKIWSAFLDLATLTVHPQVVDLLKTRIGVVDYPSTMESLLAKEWMKFTARDQLEGFVKATQYDPDGYYYVRGDFVPFETESWAWNWAVPFGTVSDDVWDEEVEFQGHYFVPSATGEYLASNWYGDSGSWVRGKDFASQQTADQGLLYENHWGFLSNAVVAPLPALAEVAGYERWDLNLDGTTASGTGYGGSDYMRLLMANVLSRNPVGFNGVVDQVLTGPFGSSFDSIIQRLASVPDNGYTVVPAALLNQAVSAAGAPALPGSLEVRLSKAELLLLAAQLKASRAFVQYVGSVNFDYPIGQTFVDVVTKVNRFDANKDGQDDLTQAVYQATPGFYFSSFLKDRTGDRRTKSKESFLSAVADAKAALAIYQTAIDDATSYYRTTLAQFIAETKITDSLPLARLVLKNFSTQLTAIETAVKGNTDLTVNENLLRANRLNPLEVLVGHMPTNANIVVRPGELWANNILDPRFWFEGNATAGFTLYFKSETWGDDEGFIENEFFKAVPADRTKLTVAFYNLASAAATGPLYRDLYAETAFKLNKASLAKFYPAISTMTLPDEALAFSFGPGWNLVNADWQQFSDYEYTYKYTYNLKPPVYVNEFLNWVNKK